MELLNIQPLNQIVPLPSPTPHKRVKSCVSKPTMRSLTESSHENFDSKNPRVHLAHQEAKQLVPKTQVCDKASTLIGNNEVHRRDERNVFGDILKGIAQEERDAKAREDDGEETTLAIIKTTKHTKNG